MEPDFYNQFDCFGKKHGFWHTSESSGHYVHGLEEGEWDFLGWDEVTWYNGFYSEGRMIGIWTQKYHGNLTRETLFII